MKVIGYIRVSTDRQSKGQSLEIQREKIQQYCKLYDLELIEIVEDSGKTSKNLEREGLQSIFHRHSKNEIDGVIVAKLDRLTRSVSDLNYLLENVFNKIELFSVSEQVDTRTPAGRLVLNILMSVSQWERETIVKRVQQGREEKAKKGGYIGGKAPLGWKVDDSGEFEPVESEQELIRKVRELRAKSMSYRKIAKLFTELKLVSRNGKDKWSHSMIQRLNKANTVGEMNELRRKHNVDEATLELKGAA